MNFKEKYPDFAAIENHIMAARVERAVYLSQAMLRGVESAVRGLERLRATVADALQSRRDRQTTSANAFLKRSVPRY